MQNLKRASSYEILPPSCGLSCARVSYVSIFCLHRRARERNVRRDH